jgi:hypothetical protein
MQRRAIDLCTCGHMAGLHVDDIGSCSRLGCSCAAFMPHPQPQRSRAQLELPSLMELVAFEQEWDERLGGRGGRTYREIACYCAARLIAGGAELEAVLSYMRAAFAVLQQPPPEDPEPARGSS